MLSDRVPIEQLRDDVRALGQLLGDVLVEQSGADLLELVERVRGQAIASREDGHPAGVALVNTISALPSASMEQLVRAFTLYFYLVNAAEEHHRLRQLHERDRSHAGEPRPESIEAAIQTLKGRGVGPNEIQDYLGRLRIHPVLTAHPSEARRRTVMQHLQRIAELLPELDHAGDPTRTRSSLAETLTALWQTDQVRVSRPTPIDEVHTGLFFFDRTLFDVLPRVYRDLARSLKAAYPEATFDIPPFLRFGTWIGGDRDGNPSVTDAITRQALATQRSIALRRYRADVSALREGLSPSVRRVGVSPELLDAVSAYADRFGRLGEEIITRNSVEPYRQMLGFVDERLRRSETGEDNRYAGAAEFIADLEVIQRSLVGNRGARIAEGALADTLWRARIFRFHLAEMELRQHARHHSNAIAEILRESGVCSDYHHLSPTERATLLAGELVNPRPLIPRELPFSPETNAVVESFRTVRAIQNEFGVEACRRYIVSMTHEVADVLVVALLAKESGLIDVREGVTPRANLMVIPLFEGIQELRDAPTILNHLYETPAYRRVVAANGELQEIMLGYSDSNKDGGYLAANASLSLAQDQLADVCVQHGVEIQLFHGRGGAIGRGGGPMGRAIGAMSSHALNARLKFTEQGEVIFARYGNPGIAHRHLEQVTSAVFLAGLDPRRNREEPGDLGHWRSVLDDLAHRSLAAYRALVESTGFERYFRESTPFPEIGQHAIASRPVSRSASARLEDVRAIPWVFSWTQSRVNLPGWYGVGTALQSYLDASPEAAETLRAMYAAWPVFRSILDNLQISLATTDLDIARLYRDAVSDRDVADFIFDQITAEFERTRTSILTVTGLPVLLGPASVLQQSIRLRNPYVDPMSVVQAILLRGLRTGGLYGDRRPLDLVLQTINGIAAGLQTTG